MATQSVCADITVEDALPDQDCTGANRCKMNCPGWGTSECQTPNPCLLDRCAKGCPDTGLCGKCGNWECTAPHTTAYCKGGDLVNPTQEDLDKRACEEGCPNRVTCGKCGNKTCAEVCASNPCAPGCPPYYTCGNTTTTSGTTKPTTTSGTTKTSGNVINTNTNINDILSSIGLSGVDTNTLVIGAVAVCAVGWIIMSRRD